MKDRSTILDEIVNDEVDTVQQMIADGDYSFIINIITERYEDKTTEELESIHQSRFDEIPDWLDED